MNSAFPPLCPTGARALILGTFPSPISREKQEYYANPRNQFWRIIFDVFKLPFDDPSYEQKKSVIFKNGIALWDVILKCESDSALDTSIRNPVYNTSLPGFIASNKIPIVLFNGGNAYKFYKRGIGDAPNNILPSTSPANARLSYAGKLELWSEALSKVY